MGPLLAWEEHGGQGINGALAQVCLMVVPLGP